MNRPSYIQRWRRSGYIWILDILGLMCWFMVLMLVLTGSVLFLEQAYNWIRFGTWHPDSIFDEFKGLLPEIILQWSTSPKDWIGLWHIWNAFLSLSAWWVNLLVAIPFALWASRVNDLSAKLSCDPPSEPSPAAGPTVAELVRSAIGTRKHNIAKQEPEE